MSKFCRNRAISSKFLTIVVLKTPILEDLTTSRHKEAFVSDVVTGGDCWLVEFTIGNCNFPDSLISVGDVELKLSHFRQNVDNHRCNCWSHFLV